jgi:sec-independent protein translocase protein TatC
MTSTHADEGRMTLIEHLTELRSRLMKCVIAVVIGGIICWIFYNQIFRALIDPYCDTLSAEAKAASNSLGGGDECRLLQTDPLEGFSIRMMIAGYGGIVLAVPVILYQLWKFIAPGLYKHERRYALPFVIVGAALFLMGGGLAYWSVPRALTFLNDIGGANLVQVFSPRPYLSFITKMILAFGIGFEFPILLAFLQMVGVVTPQLLRKYWRYAAVGIVVLVALITPSGDPITLCVLAVPMYLFYELSILYGRFWQRRKRKKEAGAGVAS